MTSLLKLTWHIAEVTPAIVRKANTIQKAIRDACAIEASDESLLINYSYYLAATRAMEYPPQARDSVRNLSAFLGFWKDLEPAEWWRFYQDEISLNLRDAWHQGFDEAQEMFESDVIELPTEALTSKQKAEAATPGHPLTLPAESLPSNS